MRYLGLLGIGLGVLFGSVWIVGEALIDMYPGSQVMDVALHSLLLAMAGFLGYRLAILYGKLKHLSLTDSLTGLYNRRYFFDQSRRCLLLASRYGYEASVVMFDVDNFKDYNDRRGHVAGDRFLQEIALLMRKNIRGSDILARYGGEEFAMCLPYTGPEEAMITAERIRGLIKGVAGQISVENPVTISAGIAVFPRDGKTIEELVHKADMALYEAKKLRNSVRLSQA